MVDHSTYLAVIFQISCDTNTPIEINDGASLEMTSAEASTKLNNVKVWVREGSFLCTVPMLDWTSVETVTVRLKVLCHATSEDVSEVLFPLSSARAPSRE